MQFQTKQKKMCINSCLVYIYQYKSVLILNFDFDMPQQTETKTTWHNLKLHTLLRW